MNTDAERCRKREVEGKGDGAVGVELHARQDAGEVVDRLGRILQIRAVSRNVVGQTRGNLKRNLDAHIQGNADDRERLRVATTDLAPEHDAEIAFPLLFLGVVIHLRDQLKRDGQRDFLGGLRGDLLPVDGVAHHFGGLIEFVLVELDLARKLIGDAAARLGSPCGVAVVLVRGVRVIKQLQVKAEHDVASGVVAQHDGETRGPAAELQAP